MRDILGFPSSFRAYSRIPKVLETSGRNVTGKAIWKHQSGKLGLLQISTDPCPLLACSTVQDAWLHFYHRRAFKVFAFKKKKKAS